MNTRAQASGSGSNYSLPQRELRSSTAASPPPSANNERPTDLDQLNDPMALAGVDVNAEEEKLKQQNREAQAKLISLGRQRNLLNQAALQQSVIAVAAKHGLKYLEPDTLPLLALAIQARLRSLTEGMIAARDHRASTSFLRPPPNYDGDFEHTGEWAPMWDEMMIDDVGKVLTAYDTIERAEERRERIARVARETAKKEEAAAREAAAAAAAAQAEPEPTTKKAKKVGKKEQVTEQQSHELMQRTAMAQLGGPKLPAWAMGGAVESPSQGKVKTTSFALDGASPTVPTTAPELTIVPLASSIERSRMPPDTLDSPINWRDAIFALERERGGGSQSGGAKALHTALAKRGYKRAAPP